MKNCMCVVLFKDEVQYVIHPNGITKIIVRQVLFEKTGPISNHWLSHRHRVITVHFERNVLTEP